MPGPPKNIYVEIVEIVDAKICKNTKKKLKLIIYMRIHTVRQELIF